MHRFGGYGPRFNFEEGHFRAGVEGDACASRSWRVRERTAGAMTAGRSPAGRSGRIAGTPSPDGGGERGRPRVAAEEEVEVRMISAPAME